MRALVLLVALLLVPALPRAAEPPPAPATFDRAALQADVDVLQQAYEALQRCVTSRRIASQQCPRYALTWERRRQLGASPQCSRRDCGSPLRCRQ